MRRIATVLGLLAAVAALAWWSLSPQEAEAPDGPDRASPTTQEPDSTRIPRLRVALPRDARERVIYLHEHLRALRARFDAGVATENDVAETERALWIARVAAREVSEKASYTEVARLDAEALSRVERREEQGVVTPDVKWVARVRLQQSKRRAGHDDEEFTAVRAAYLQFLAADNEARLRSGVSTPREVHRRVFDACSIFPSADGAKDAAWDRAGAALRDVLAADLERVGAQTPGARRVALELELVDVCEAIGDVAADDAHTQRAVIYEQVFRELERRTGATAPSSGDLAAARLRWHREMHFGGENNQYVRLREQLFRDERKRLDTLVSNGLLGPSERATTMERLRVEFPAANVLEDVPGD